MQHRSRQQQVLQRVDQWLEFQPASTDPLRPRRARLGQSRPLEDAFLAVQQDVIEVLPDQHVRQETCRRDPLVDQEGEFVSRLRRRAVG
jgi:hypothetical protein